MGANLPVLAPAPTQGHCLSNLNDESTIQQVAAAQRELVCQWQHLHCTDPCCCKTIWLQTCHQPMLHLGCEVATKS